MVWEGTGGYKLVTKFRGNNEKTREERVSANERKKLKEQFLNVDFVFFKMV